MGWITWLPTWEMSDVNFSCHNCSSETVQCSSRPDLLPTRKSADNSCSRPFYELLSAQSNKKVALGLGATNFLNLALNSVDAVRYRAKREVQPESRKAGFSLVIFTWSLRPFYPILCINPFPMCSGEWSQETLKVKKPLSVASLIQTTHFHSFPVQTSGPTRRPSLSAQTSSSL